MARTPKFWGRAFVIQGVVEGARHKHKNDKKVT